MVSRSAWQTVSPEQAGPPLRRLFQPLEHHLAIASILDGLTPGALFADDVGDPSWALAWFHSRVYLAGRPPDPPGWQALASQMLAAGQDAFILHSECELNAEQAAALLPERRWLPGVRRHYACTRPPHGPRAALPEGYTLRSVDAALLSEPGLGGLDWLREEMVSERPSVAGFLEKSFGVCLVYAGAVVGWCLSEYNCRGRCEVGVAVAEAHQRRGLGRALSLALLDQAFGRGMREVGWHCWARNVASGALARSAGFELRAEFPVWVCLLDE